MARTFIFKALFGVVLMQSKVTSFLVSGKNCRITQVCHVHEAPISVPQSDIFTLEGSEEEIRPTVKLLVSWFLGDLC